MSAHTLRDYQAQGDLDIRRYIAQGQRKIMVKMPTGAGKTTLFSHILRGLEQKGNHGIMAVRGRQLVDQASERLTRESTRHGVLMANHWKKDAQALIQICSIDTIMSRGVFPPAKVLVLDEAHLLTSPASIEFVNHYAGQGTIILAFTASPWTRESLRHMAEVVVEPIKLAELIEQGYLVPPRYFAPSVPNLKGVNTVNGDYVNSQLQERMSVLTGDIVSTWLKKGEGRPTICFGVNIKHSQEIVAAFKAAGIPAEHIEGNNSREERQAAIRRLVSGQTKILSNVGVLCTGVDIPPVSCLIMARPTQSYNLYVQQAGRGTRCDYAPGMPLATVDQRLAAIAASNKKDFIILDHAGNIIRHGFITNEPEVDLDGIKKKKLDTGPAPRRCGICYLNYTGPSCPECGPVAKEEREIGVEDGELKEMTDTPFAAELVQFVKRCKDTAKKHGYKRGWVYHQVKDRYGIEIANELFPKRKRPDPGFPPWLVRSSFSSD